MSSSPSFLDQVTITVTSGQGGNGAVSWRKEKYVPFGGPAGGDGGRGGSVYLEANDKLQTLVEFRFNRFFEAENGERGGNKNMHGKGGEDLTIGVPCGTLVKDAESGELLADLMEHGQRMMVALGGRGGRGNTRFTTAKNKAPHYAEPGEPPIVRKLTLELKLLADVGLIGLPNAGKSTLISVLSAARPKIANYPFTTLVPNLGVLRKPSGDGLVLADIPGLIEGASEGSGLGHDFLRHVERTRLLLHLVDANATDGGTPLANYQLIQQELAQYNPELAQRPQQVLLTKVELLEPEALAALQQELDTHLQTQGQPPSKAISASTGLGIEALKQWIVSEAERLPAVHRLPWAKEDAKATDNDDSAFEVVLLAPAQGDEPANFGISGGKISRWLTVTLVEQPQSLRRFLGVMKAMGVFKALAQQGAQTGDTITIDGTAFEFDPEFDVNLGDEMSFTP